MIRNPTIRRMRYRARNAIGGSPRLYLPVARLQNRGAPDPIMVGPGELDPDKRRVVSPEVEIVIEGFPRSANSFAAAAFKLAQRRPVLMAHHVHLPAQVIAAVRWDIPTLVLIRDPIGATSSLLIRQPYLTPRQALAYYGRFYRSIADLRGRFVIATFEEATSDFGAVTQRINRKFGSRFVEFDHDEENVEAVFATLEQRSIHGAGRGRVSEVMVSRPSETRASIRDSVVAQLRTPGLARLLHRAEEVYGTFTN